MPFAFPAVMVYACSLSNFLYFLYSPPPSALIAFRVPLDGVPLNWIRTRTGVDGGNAFKSGETEPAKAHTVAKVKERVSRSGLFIVRSRSELCIPRAIRK